MSNEWRGLRNRPAIDWLADAFVILFGVIATMTVCGYEFAHGDHTVYLVEPLHLAHPELLRNDWFTTQTLQYHSAFSGITSILMRLNIVSQGFLIGYLALVFIFQMAWLTIVRTVGGSRTAYLLSIILYFMSRGGVVLASYSILQDSELLASNIAAVMLLVGIALWLRRWIIPAGLAFGMAGMFHLNYAVAAIGGWCGLVALSYLIKTTPRLSGRALLVGTLFMLAGAFPNIIHALPGALKQRHAGMPLAQFIELYVRIRHPHHYDPSRWSGLEWLTFCWPIPFAVFVLSTWTRRGDVQPEVIDARRQLARVYIGFAIALLIAFIGAGIWYLSTTLVQLSLYRFGVYVHLIGCIAAALLVCDGIARPVLPTARIRRLMVFGTGVSIVIAAMLIVAFGTTDPTNGLESFRRYFAPALIALTCLAFVPAVYAIVRAYAPLVWQRRIFAVVSVLLLALLAIRRGTWRGMVYVGDHTIDQMITCQWIRDPKHTPLDAIFLVSPGEQIFRLHAQRAIVVNFKSPPQLTTELPQWRDRLQDVLGMPSLAPLADFRGDMMGHLDELYDAVPDQTILAAARKYGAEYILLSHRLPGQFDSALVYSRENGTYFLYHIPL